MELFSFKAIILALVVLILIRTLVKYFIKPYFMLQEFKKLNGAVCYYIPIIGGLAQLRKSEKEHGDPCYVTRKIIQENPEIRFLAAPFLDKMMIELHDTELLRELLAKQKSVEKDMRLFGVVSDFAKLGLIFTEGEKWKAQRKLVSKVFHFEYMSECLVHINVIAKKWLARNCKDSTSTVNVTKELKRYTGNIIWQIFFGDEVFADEDQAEKDIQRMLDNGNDALILVTDPLITILGPNFYKLGLRALDRKYKADNVWVQEYCRRQFETYKKKILDDKAKGTVEGRPKHLIELLIEASLNAEESEKIPDIEIQSQIRTFLMAGTDTTANTLTIAHYFLAQYPEVQEKAREEVKKYIGDSEEIKYDQLSKLDYLTAFLKECFRMYGPASTLFPRVVKEDITLKDLTIRKGYCLSVAVNGICYNPKYFPNPFEFRPERWIEKQEPGVKDPLAFIPFAAGSRKCIGEHLAYIEAKLLLAELLRNYKIDMKRPYELKMKIGLVYEPVDTLHAIYTKLPSK